MDDRSEAPAEPEQPAGSRRRSALVAAIVLVAVVCAAGFAYSRIAPGTSGTATSDDRAASVPGRQVDDFTLLDSSGNQVALSQVLGESPVVINCWATWCPYCVAEMDDWQSLYDTYGDRVAFMMVDIADGSRETVADGKAYIKQKGYTFPVYFDTTGAAVKALQVTSYPTTTILSKDGGVVRIVYGKINRNVVSAALESAIAAR